MLVLFETSAGYSLFKVSDEKILKKTDSDDIYESFFDSTDKAKDFVNLVSFQPFADTADAVTAATACIEGKISASLKKFLKKQFKSSSKDGNVGLAVADKALANSIKESKIGNSCTVMNDSKTNELFRGIRTYVDDLLEGSNKDEPGIMGRGSSSEIMKAMQLGLSHSLSRYKLKFSADKVDTMIIQAVGLLDELDKEINTYAMRVKEWYGWHFPELQALVGDNVQYSKLVLKVGLRPSYKATDLSNILEDESIESSVKDAAEISMGTEIADLDIINIRSLAEQVLSLSEYRIQLYDYLKNRMNAIAPNLTILVGELVGARLIGHAGSLMNLAKQPASTVQILGAEKALFRALKTKHDTPKYGLIYHASLVGQATPKNKGKISRVLAAKASLAIRVDALSDDVVDESGAITMEPDTTIGYEGRAKVEARLRQLEQQQQSGGSTPANRNGALTAKKTAKYDPVAAKASATSHSYNDKSDMVLDTPPAKTSKDDTEEETTEKKKKKKKKDKSEKKAKKEKRKSSEAGIIDAEEKETEETPSSKKKKRKADEVEEGNNDDDDDEAEKKSAKKAAKKAKKDKKSRKSKGE